MFRTVGTTLLALAVLANGTAAQSDEGVKVGFGVALNPIAIGDLDFDASVLPVGLGNFTVPIQIGSSLRFEPELGIFRAHAESSSNGSTSKYTESLMRYGLAAHYLFGGSESFRPYVGPRFGFIRQSSDQEFTGSTPTESKRTDSYFGLALGGEYWFTPHFSLGGEVQVNRISIGDEEVTNQPAPTGSYDASIISSNGVVAVKFYL